MAGEMYRYNREANSFAAVEQADVCRRAQGAGEAIAIGSSSAASGTAFPSGTTAVRLVSTVDCWVEIAPTPVAVVNTSFYLPANSPEYLIAAPGDRVAVIQASAAGFLYERPVS
ncbi:MAG: hypothetical protein RJA99_4229 [Pseudomonadota bacterium]|jgi:hypothetical protein